MGIPSYFSYIVKNHSNIIKKYNGNNDIKINNFYLDCNSIIYDAIHNIDFSKIEKNQYKFIIDYVIKKIDSYIDLIKPNENIIIAFDGVAPVAKLEQQRQRRFKSSYQNKISKKIFKDSKPDSWNTAAITPGTEFMKILNEQIQKNYDNNKKYDNLKIIVSTSQQYGEGEHKIFKYIRDYPDEHFDKTSVIYGLDADLIMLSINHLPICKNIFLFRETPEFIKSINSDLEPNETYLMYIP